MKNAGINASVVMDIIGHESEAISAHYTHIDEETKRKAIALLPDIQSGGGYFQARYGGPVIPRRAARRN